MKRCAVLPVLLIALNFATDARAEVGDFLFKLLADDGAANDTFGNSVALSNGKAVVGAPNHLANGVNSGIAYVFDVATGTQLLKLLPNDPQPGALFGVSVSVSDNIAIVGAHRTDDNGNDSGSAYLFDVTTGAQLLKIMPQDGAAFDEFGVSVDISGNTAIVGAYLDDDNGTFSGSAYLFDATTGAQLFKFVPSDNAERDQFGISVGISGNTAIVGARFDDDSGADSGSATGSRGRGEVLHDAW